MKRWIFGQWSDTFVFQPSSFLSLQLTLTQTPAVAGYAHYTHPKHFQSRQDDGQTSTGMAESNGAVALDKEVLHV